MINQSELVVFGDAALDVFMEVSNLPSRGEDIKVNRRVTFPGGSAANCAAMSAGLGIPTRFLGNVGTDALGNTLIEDMKKAGVNTDHLVPLLGDSAVTTSVITPDGERTFYSYRGVNALANPLHLKPGILDRAVILHLTGYSFQAPGSQQTALSLLAMTQNNPIRISIDPSFVFARDFLSSPDKLLSQINYFFPNRLEARLICGTEDPEKAAGYLIEAGVETVVFKLDQEGCLLVNRQESRYVPGFPLKNPLDTTGAGDAFCGGYLAGQIWGLTDEESAVIGHAAAANIVLFLGGHTHLLTLPTLQKLLNEHQYTQLAQKLEKMGKSHKGIIE